MAKEFVIEKAFKETVSKEDKTPKTWSNAHGEFQTWIVRVEGEDFWFRLNKKVENVITPGDTIHGLFDEETVTPKNGEPFTVKKFVKIDRPDGEHDKVQARDGAATQGSETAPTKVSGATESQLDYIVQMLEELTGRRTIEAEAPATKPATVAEEEPINLDDLNL